MPYAAHEKAYIIKVYHTLVSQDLIGIKEINEYGDPEPDYSDEGRIRLVTAIQQLASYPWRDHSHNALLQTDQDPDSIHQFITRQTWELEVPDLLEKTDIQALLRAHPKYEQKMAEWAAANQQHLFSD
jgi:hypothetical protein